MSSIVLRGASGFATSSNQTTLGVTFPTNLQVGDFMFVWCAINASALSSWTDSSDGLIPVTVGYTQGDLNVQLLWKIATATDATNAKASTSYTITSNATAAPWTAIAGAYGGVNPDGPFDAIVSSSGNPASATTITALGFQVQVPNDQLVWFGASGASSGALPTISAPSGYTAQISQINTATGSGTQMCALFADKVSGSPGIIGNQTGALSASHGNAGLLLALVPKNPVQVFDFESGVDGFTAYPGTHVTLAQSTGWARSGTHSALITTDGTYTNALITVGQAVIAGAPYFETAWVMSPAGWASGAKLQADCYTSSSATNYVTSFYGVVSPALPAGVAVTLPTLQFTLPTTVAFIHVLVVWEGTPAITDMLYVDDVTFGPWPGRGNIPGRRLLL